MNAQKIYDSLILKRRTDVLSRAIAGVERHHVIPRSWGGNNNPVNLVFLTYREHFLAHRLLSKVPSSPEKKLKMIYAVKRMCRHDKFNSREYQRITKQWHQAQDLYMNEIIGEHGETRRKLTTQKSARTMLNTKINGKSLKEIRIGKISKNNSDICEWEHLDGRTFTGTALELSRTHRGELIEPSKMMKRFGTNVRHRGWRSKVGVNAKTKLEVKYSEIFSWVCADRSTFVGTCYELSKMHPKGLYPNKLQKIAENGGSFGGWKIGGSK